MVDDDPQTLRYVRNALTETGYAPVVTGDPEQVPGLVRKHRPALVLLDLVLPGTDGIELLERFPEVGDLPVIFISAYGRDETVVKALDAGAADYIVKPFSASELTARVRAALRRRAEPEPFVLGELTVHYDQRRVAVAGRPVELTATEFELLRVLSVNAGRALNYDALLRQAWGHPGRGSADPKLPKRVRAVVKRLRRKLGDDHGQPGLHPQRARRRLPHARTRRTVRPGPAFNPPGLQRAPAAGQPARWPPARDRPAAPAPRRPPPPTPPPPARAPWPQPAGVATGTPAAAPASPGDVAVSPATPDASSQRQGTAQLQPPPVAPEEAQDNECSRADDAVQ